jgi:putative sporulation protein YtxC
MNSLCIKTNNEKALEYLQNEFSTFNMLNVSFSCNEFKLYKNIIIHYTGVDKELFYTKLATIFSYLVIDNFESDIIKNMLISNYFYFDNFEFQKILDICEENLCDEEFSFQNRQLALFDAFYNYIIEHHSIVLSGFINFRLFNYRYILEDLLNLSVNEFLVEREYLEFTSLVKLYVESQLPRSSKLHIVCFNSDTFLLDENMKKIDIDKSDLNAKYLSDVSFSDNDYILNTLLKLLPAKIYLHVSSSSIDLNFINTLKLIFDSRFEICTDCNICNLYKNLDIHQKK